MNLGQDPIETAKKFMGDYQVGWIDPDGDVHAVPLYNHAAFFGWESRAIPAIYTFWKEIEDEALSRHSRQWREDHPDLQWHEYIEPEYNPAYDDELGDMLEVIMKAVYVSGWGRIGAFHGGRFELECHPDHERHLTRKAREFAEVLGRELTVRTNSFDWVDTRGYLDEIFAGETSTPAP
jgi:hypothetical protein